MRRVAANAAYPTFQVYRAAKIEVLEVAFVALQAAFAALRWGQLGKTNDFGRVAAGIHMRRSRTVTIFASMLLRFEQSKMRRSLKVF